MSESDNPHGLLETAPDALRYEFQSDESDSVAARIRSFLTPGSRILDVGCGTGALAESIKSRLAVEVVGIEPNAERAAIAKNRGLNVFQGVLSDEFLAEYGLFDVIIFADVLEHLADPGEMLLLAKRGLAPGGAIIVSVPNVAHWFVRWDLLRGRFDYRETGIMDATHLRWFTRESLSAWLRRMGFQITACTTTVNIDLPEYRERLPWKFLSRPVKLRVVKTLVRSFPTLFACQYIVRATLP
jgi:methionine biosynthesis protein MetW